MVLVLFKSSKEPARPASDADHARHVRSFSPDRKRRFTDFNKCVSSAGSKRENAPPSVVSYPGHTMVIASNAHVEPFSPAYRTARPVPALSAYAKSLRARGKRLRVARTCASRSSQLPSRLNRGVASGRPRCPRRSRTATRKPRALAHRANPAKSRAVPVSVCITATMGASSSSARVSAAGACQSTAISPPSCKRIVSRSKRSGASSLCFSRYASSCMAELCSSRGASIARCSAGVAASSDRMRGDAGGRIRGRCASCDVFLRQDEASAAANAAASAAANALATSVASSRTPPEAPATPASAFGTTAPRRVSETRGDATTEGADRRGEPPEFRGWPTALRGRRGKERRTRTGGEIDTANERPRDTRAAPRAAGA